MYMAQFSVAAMLVATLYQTGISDFLGMQQLRTGTSNMHLVKNGWYRYMRHPLYFLSLLFMVLNPVMTVQWLLLLCCSLIYFIAGAFIEEKRLLEFFGDEYRDYMLHTPFFIPGLERSTTKRR